MFSLLKWFSDQYVNYSNSLIKLMSYYDNGDFLRLLIIPRSWFKGRIIVGGRGPFING
jgi:hypothetical protein